MTSSLHSEYKRNARFIKLKEHDYFAREHDFAEITEWYNGEGFDLNVSSVMGNQNISLTWGEYGAIKAVVGDWFNEDEELLDSAGG